MRLSTHSFSSIRPHDVASRTLRDGRQITSCRLHRRRISSGRRVRGAPMARRRRARLGTHARAAGVCVPGAGSRAQRRWRGLRRRVRRGWRGSGRRAWRGWRGWRGSQARRRAARAAPASTACSAWRTGWRTCSAGPRRPAPACKCSSPSPLRFLPFTVHSLRASYAGMFMSCGRKERDDLLL